MLAVVLGDLAARSATLLPVCVDTLAVLHLRHKDELFVGLSDEVPFDYIDVLKKFRTRTPSGNPVIYNCSNPGLCGRKKNSATHIPTPSAFGPLPSALGTQQTRRIR